MIKVFIPGPYSIPIWRQFPDSKRYVWKNCEFYFEEPKEYDYLVVWGLEKELSTLCPKEKRLCFLGEPPYVKRYTKAFREQFGYVFGCQPKMIRRGEMQKLMPTLAWMAGCKIGTNVSMDDFGTYMSYQDFKYYEPKEQRLNKVCFITSNKKFTRGHRDRVNFANKILKNHIDFIDIYGNGYNPIDDKLEVLSKYKYVLAIENGLCMDYWTEKLADSYLAGCHPIYYGCPNISDYFEQDSMTKVNIRDYNGTINTIKDIIERDVFSTSREAVLTARNQVLDEYNMFNLIANEVSKIDSYNYLIEKMSLPEIIYPMKYNLKDLVLYKLARLFNIVL
ncbi:glycosyltransferase family 10 [Bacteroides caccae]|uniref:Glycosyltransferase family 10 n=1 Tax=Bacteroides caccae TaxID=47678 RepID=A0AA94XZ40_9BACE|nr:glycosyltransferase family 10 [Bacteroides caccae]